MEPMSCPCCGYRTLPERGEREVCGLCGWKDDPSQLAFPDRPGENRLSLREAQRAFRAAEAAGRTRPAATEEARDPSWSFLDGS